MERLESERIRDDCVFDTGIPLEAQRPRQEFDGLPVRRTSSNEAISLDEFLLRRTLPLPLFPGAIRRPELAIFAFHDDRTHSP